MGNDFKTICYRGGVVTFRIPSNWREEYEPREAGLFTTTLPTLERFA